MEKLNQLTLGELINLLEADTQDKCVVYDFGDLVPTSLSSYRGYYHHLALGWRQSDSEHSPPSVKDLLAELGKGIGGVYSGWKGGEYVMSKDTPVWAANQGKDSRTAIVGVGSSNHSIYTIIHTAGEGRFITRPYSGEVYINPWEVEDTE